jgi:hypothetical protein
VHAPLSKLEAFIELNGPVDDRDDGAELYKVALFGADPV